jgi:hypothetical protein
MYPASDNIEHPLDAELLSHLAAAGVRSRRLSAKEHLDRDAAWRAVYGQCFRPDVRMRHGERAVYEYLRGSSTQWLLVPFLSDVPGTPMGVQTQSLGAYECEGPVAELGDFNNAEFFVSPPDFGWTFVSTHEDFMLGGPYFVRAHWVLSRLPRE